MKKYDVLVIGSGLSGLAAASLLAKSGYNVCVLEQTFKPGGSCGIFKRQGAVFDQGSAMLYGFGETGFNSHRFLYNTLEIPIKLIKHDSLYSVYFKGKRIVFHYDIDKYIEELRDIFPNDIENFKKFFSDMKRLYEDVIAAEPVYSTPDHTDRRLQMEQVKKHPNSYIKFLSLMNKSTYHLLNKYFKNPDVFNYFNKLTSTYCYTNVKQTPAVMAAVMFVDNHVGGSYYPVGSTLYVPGLLEKYIEEHGGDMMYNTRADKIIVGDGCAKGAVTDSGDEIFADRVIYSGTVWNLYAKMLDKSLTSVKKRRWAASQKPSYPSVILYALVKKEAIPHGTSPITLFTESEDSLDEDEVTAYIFGIDAPDICPEDYNTVMAIGPTMKQWPKYSESYQANPEYIEMKNEEETRLINVMERHFPGFAKAVVHKEVSTPLSIERYTLKNKGSVAGPLQSMGQHMLKRLGITTEIKNLYCCGESTTMGTGTPAVTVSGITACNVILKEDKKPQFLYKPGMKNYVKIHSPGYKKHLTPDKPEEMLIELAWKCEYCEHPSCMEHCSLDIRGINRRLAVGNIFGASKILDQWQVDEKVLKQAQKDCVLNQNGGPVKIVEIIKALVSCEIKSN